MKRENVRTNKAEKVQRTDNTPKEVTEILRVKKKYNFKYVMFCKLLETHLIFIFIMIFFIATKQTLSFVSTLLIYLGVVIVALILYKKSAQNTYVSFQENKVVYRRKFLFINKKEEMSYKEIKEITFQYEIGTLNKIWQKHTNLGNMTIHPKKGNVFIYGIEITNISPFDKIMVDVKNNIGDKIE